MSDQTPPDPYSPPPPPQDPKSGNRFSDHIYNGVNRTMVKISGKRPEELPPAEDIKEVQKKLKSSHREIKRLDKPKD